MKTKEIIAAVNNLKVVFKSICGKCQEYPLKTPTLINELHNEWDKKLDIMAKAAKEDGEGMDGIIDELRQAFQAVCLTCSKVSNDDNPSNHGQTFVSLDSGNCQANSGRAKSTHTDDNVVLSRADWIGLHKAPEADIESAHGLAPDESLMLKEEGRGLDPNDQTSTYLPAEVEDKLRTEFANFMSLDIIDKLLLSCILSGMNIAEFAKMLWFPYSIVDPKTRTVKAITKQAAHARWINICKRFPVFMAVAVSTNKGSKKAMDRLRQFVQNPNSEEPSDKFVNGKLSAPYAKIARKNEKDLENLRKMANELSALKDENSRLRKVVNTSKEKIAALESPEKRHRGKPKTKQVNNTGMLPGLF